MKSAPNILRPRSMRCSRMPPPPSSARARPIRPRPGKRSCSLPNARPSRSRAHGAWSAIQTQLRIRPHCAPRTQKICRASRAFGPVSDKTGRSIKSTRRLLKAAPLTHFLKRAGAELDDSEKPRFAALQERQAALSKEFADHALDATDAYSIRITQEDELAGLPDNARAAARNAAEKAGAAGWRFTLHLPSYLPVLQYAEHRPLREAMYRAYVSRASELG